MYRYLVIAAALTLASPAATASALTAAVRPAAVWGQAQEVPGTAALNTLGDASVFSVSCPSTGDCVAGGNYENADADDEGFVVSQVSGTWGQAQQVPGLAALNAGGDAGVQAVSCASAGNCVAGGYYNPSSSTLVQEVFVASETDGVWGQAAEVPGLAALNTGNGAQVGSVSCASAGNCSLGGYYRTDGSRSAQQAFVVSEAGGVWGQAKEVPGTGALNQGGNAGINAVSCASDGNCSAGGWYYPSSVSISYQAFVVSETGGTWGKAKSLAGTSAYNDGTVPGVASLSCASAGNCSAGGNYTPAGDTLDAFVVNQVDGTWSAVKEVPGSGALNTGNDASVVAVSCPSVGNCSAGGFYNTSSGDQEAFVVNRVSGTWGQAKEVPGIAALNQVPIASVTALSCASAGNCSAAGTYRDSSGHTQVFVASRVSGTWGKAGELPGSGALNTGGVAYLPALSCAPGGTCSAGGSYLNSAGYQAFVASQT